MQKIDTFEQQLLYYLKLPKKVPYSLFLLKFYFI